MMAKITGNKGSLQVIIPKDLCEVYHLQAGDRVAVREDSRGILILKGNLPGIQTGVWTVGYEGLSLKGFVNTLEVASIEQVVDVRELPLSRKYGDCICTAGITDEGDWIRLCPVPLGLFRRGKGFRKFDWIEVDCKSAANEEKLGRKESHIEAPVNEDYPGYCPEIKKNK